MPIYPVRYAVKGVKHGTNETTWVDNPAGDTLNKLFPKLNNASYTLRSIPKDYFILIVEDFSGITNFRMFQNSEERKGFIEIDWLTYCEDYKKTEQSPDLSTRA